MLSKNHKMPSKSSTLISLRGKISCARVLPCSVLITQDWAKDSLLCLAKVFSDLPEVGLFIVRSSAQSEDQAQQSLAGQFDSVLNVKKEILSDAINQVISSYGDSQSSTDEILIQPMLQNVTISGVMFTYDPNNNSPYYIINYDSSGDTSAVTAGKSTSNTVYISREIAQINDPLFEKLIALAKELESILDNKKLDIEFAFDQSGDLYLFQVRPLVVKHQVFKIDHKTVLHNIKHKIQSLNLRHPYLAGDRTILGVMPDWNPAEIIGIRPKPLALSLYKELITDSTWAYQRDNYGYKNLRSFPLLIDLCGSPYIDVRVSFNSFIPKSLPEPVAEKLVNYYLDKLENSPYLHDKIEFDIVFSCYTFDLPARLKTLKKHGFDDEEIKTLLCCLKDLTNTIIHKNKGLWRRDIEKIKELQKRHDLILSNQNFDKLTKIYWLIEDCKRHGTLPFAGLARAGFIAVQLLNSMVAVDIITTEEKVAFLNSLNSVSSNLTTDMKKLSKDEFLKKYGHLRPGTYDILSLRYDEAPDTYFDWSNIDYAEEGKTEDFKLNLNQLTKIEELLDQHGLDHDVIGLFNFMKAAIEGREYSKFIFTRILSDVLCLIKKVASKYGFDEEDASFIDLKKLLDLYSSAWDLETEIHALIKNGKSKYQTTKALNLPPLIFKPEDVEFFKLPENKPNFITLKKITAPVVDDLLNTQKLKGAIVFIPSADPGFDWIFTRGISGFVTAYGGVNSHMAIRAGELGLPAVIGSGEKLYNQWLKGKIIHMDCANHRVEVVR
jgi:hypothetical protein